MPIEMRNSARSSRLTVRSCRYIVKFSYKNSNTHWLDPVLLPIYLGSGTAKNSDTIAGKVGWFAVTFNHNILKLKIKYMCGGLWQQESATVKKPDSTVTHLRRERP